MLGGSCDSCCGGSCLVWKSEGWSGWLTEVDSRAINGDGGTSLPNASLPFTSELAREAYVGMSVLCEENLIRITIPFSILGSGYYESSRIVLERTGTHGLLDGDVVSVSDVVENTIPGQLNAYNKKPVDTTGTIFLKIERANDSEGRPVPCDAGCSPNFFTPGYLSYLDTPSTPGTMTLRFTNLASQPSGPRWPPESYGGSTYGGFLPPNSIREYFAPHEIRSACDSFMDRFARPIVMRKVQGTSYTYLSDPIAIRPCCQVRYRFDACPTCYSTGFNDCGRNPRLSVASVTSAQRPIASHPSSFIFGDFPLSSWKRSEYLQSPESWQEAKDNASYSFGGFAIVSPGGEYEPEQQLLCGGTLDDSYSLSEGCFGRRCPPDEIEVDIDGGDRPSLAGTYVLPSLNRYCLPHQGTFTSINYFDGLRYSYQKTFVRDGLLLDIAILRNRSAGAFGNWEAPDMCGCEQRPVGLQINWRPSSLAAYPTASTNVTRYPNAGMCLPMCFDGTSEAVFDNVTLQQNDINGSTFPSIGRVVVRFKGST